MHGWKRCARGIEFPAVMSMCLIERAMEIRREA
jgi:hypothetical protein